MHRDRVEATCGQRRRVEVDGDTPGPAADDRDLRDVGQLLQRFLELLADLEAGRPRIVALQKKDWAPDVEDSADYFLSQPALRGWLLAHYDEAAGPDAFRVWIRKTGAS